MKWIYFLAFVSAWLFSIAANAEDAVKLDLKNSRLYQSCDKSINAGFENSYCSNAIRGIWHGYVLALYHYPGATECNKAAFNDIDGRVSFVGHSPLDVAKNFLKYAENKNLPQLKIGGVNDIEIVMVQSILEGFSGKKGLTLNDVSNFTEPQKSEWLPTWLKPRMLYLSCSSEVFREDTKPISLHEISKGRELCEGTIRGLAMGRTLALHNLPEYKSPDKCADEKNEIIERIRKRTCLKDDGSQTYNVSQKFVDDVKKMRPEEIMQLGSDRRVEWILAPYVISEQCRRNSP